VAARNSQPFGLLALRDRDCPAHRGFSLGFWRAGKQQEFAFEPM